MADEDAMATIMQEVVEQGEAEDCFNLWYLRFCAAAEQLNYNEKGKLRKNTLTEKPKVSGRCNELWWLRVGVA